MESGKLQYHTIVTHRHPHVDEIAGILFLKDWGGDKYPGIDKARVIFWDAGLNTLDGKSWKVWHAQGYLLVGVGGSCFDEHVSVEKRSKTCAALLIAQDLGIENEPWMKKVLKYVVSNDINGGNSPHDIAALTRQANEQWFDKDPQKAFNFCTTMLRLQLNDQINFFVTAKDDFDQYGEVVMVNHCDRMIKVVFIESNNTKVGGYARSEFGRKCDVVVIRNEKGNVIITTNKAPVNLSNVICGLRGCEAKIAKTMIPCKQLAMPGTIDAVKEWYYDPTSNQILNGGKSASGIPATKINYTVLKKIIVERLEHTASVKTYMKLSNAS